MTKSNGGLWIKTSKKGLEYLSGQIEINGCKYDFAAFKNNYKEDGDRKPDYVIKLREERSEELSPV